GAACAKQLASLGYRAEWRRWSSSEIARAKVDPPAAVLIDLSRTPSVGRDVAIAMRAHRALLAVPFLLVDGAPEVVAKLKEFLPDAVLSDRRRIKTSLAAVLKKQPPGARLLSVFAAYEDVSLAKKLGSKRVVSWPSAMRHADCGPGSASCRPAPGWWFTARLRPI
ncbi:MAG: hypothetical protein JO121_16825, partial [Deltaproteobacteria bacterium]|nr:hypothetical protein [Deltaproteobacteria bacterium]